MPIHGIIGGFGAGKTLLLTWLLKRGSVRGRRVLSNYGLKFPHEKLDADTLMEMDRSLTFCFIGVDEIHVLIDSRRAGSERNLLISYFILQTRKRAVDFAYTTQHEGQVDIRLRRSTDFWIYCERVPNTPYFHYEIYERLDGLMLEEFWLDGRSVYPDYDTTEAITDFYNPAHGPEVVKPKPRGSRVKL